MNWELIYDALEVMGKGMLGIFIALTIVYGFVLALTKFCPVKEEESENKE